MTDMTTSSLLFGATVRVSLVLVIALAVVWCLRRRSAAARHWVLSVAIVCALVVPLLSALAPTWYVPVSMAGVGLAGGHDGGAPATPDARLPGGVSTVNVTLSKPTDPVATPQRAVPTIAGLLAPVWMFGVAAVVTLLSLGLLRLAWLSARATPVSDPRWLELAAETASRLGLVRSVRLLQSTHPTLLATWGLLRPRVMLPAGAEAWETDRVQVVLAHELAHVRRGDWAVQLAADVLRALFWFNPLMWIATRCLRRDSELACDDAVLGLGVGGPDYATQLLDLAKALRSPRPVLSPGVAMARPSGLERRISAMVNPTLSRQPFLLRSRLAVVAAALALTVPLAVLAQSFGSGTVSGTVVDSAGQPWAGARVTLSVVGQHDLEVRLKKELADVQEGRLKVELAEAQLVFRHEVEKVGATVQLDRIAREQLHWAAEGGGQGEKVRFSFVARDIGRWTVRSDDDGRFEIEDVPPGEYRLEVSLPGFSTVKETVTVAAGRRVQRDIALQVGALEETYTVAAGQPAPVPTSVDPATLEERRQRMGDGPLQPPIKLRGLNPAYPDELRASGTQGSVILEAVVAANGSIEVLNVLTPVDPDLLTPVQPELARAAVAAVRQWFYEPTRLHGVPVDTRMTVTIHFTTES